MSITVIPFVRPASPPRQARQSPRWSLLLAVIVAVPVAIAACFERRRQRERLGELAEDKRLLKDIGLTREQALYEGAKPFWR